MYESDRKVGALRAAALDLRVFDAWNALWEGAASVHNRRLVLTVTRRLDWGDPCFEWRIRERPGRGSC
jgi:hypothetical protein